MSLKICTAILYQSEEGKHSAMSLPPLCFQRGASSHIVASSWHSCTLVSKQVKTGQGEVERRTGQGSVETDVKTT